MSLGLIGTKCGMTRVFTEAGESIPVTVIHVPENRVTQIKNDTTDGYTALQVAALPRKRHRASKADLGHFTKAGVEISRVLKEFRIAAEQLADYEMGASLPLSYFAEGQAVDVRGISKGKGFAGPVKRHHFRTQDATHGNSLSHRAHGSVGQCQNPGRVFKGKKMAGQLGRVQRCAVNQKIVSVDEDNRLILVRGAIPGAPGGIVVITPTTKHQGKQAEDK